MRRYLLTLGGLALCAGPLFAQEYVDLEQERALSQADSAGTANSAGTTNGADTANSAATAPNTTYLPPPAQNTGQAQSSQGGNLGELYYQMQLLQQEVMELRGTVGRAGP